MSEIISEETQVVDKPYINIENELYITVDYALKVVVACDYVMGEYYQTTCGRLKEVSSDLALELTNHFKIDLAEFGVGVLNSKPLLIEGEK